MIHLSVLFSTAMGRTFKDVVLGYRMDRAKELLHQRDKTVTEIAFEVGYRDPGYFATAFKRITGITPGQYRKKMPQPGSPLLNNRSTTQQVESEP